jgi:hypothetical protein
LYICAVEVDLRPMMVLALLAACKPLETPTPTLTAVDPGLICRDHDGSVTVTGTNLAPVGTDVMNDATLVLPTLAWTHALTLDGAAGTGDVVDVDTTDPAVVQWLDAQTMTVAITAAEALPEGVYDLSVTNADGQIAVLEGALAVAAAPTVTSVEPVVFCGDEDATTLTLTGTGFLTVGGALPTVTVGSYTAAADGADGCTPLAGPVAGERCTTLTLSVPANAVPSGVAAVTVTNPAPADCTSSPPFSVQIVSSPVIDSLDPDAVCTDNGTATIGVDGSGFLVVGTTDPTVTVDGTAVPVDGVSGCADLAVEFDGQMCTHLDITVDTSAFTLGDYDVVVINPEPASCASDPFPLSVVEPPTIASILPESICDSGGSFTITGDGFAPTATVDIDGTAASTTFVDAQHLDVDAPGGLSVGFHTVTVSNASGCSISESSGIEVVPAPLLFYVDPPVAYSGLSIAATLYVAGITGDVTEVTLEDASGTVTSLVYDFDPSNPDTIQATIPAGLAEGDYTVSIVQDGTCPSLLADAVHVEADATVAIESIDPQYAWTGGYTPVSIGATNPLPNGMEAFGDVPRIYLNPTSTSTTAVPLVSVGFVDPYRLDALIPPGLDVDVYDVVVVNPDGAVGVLAGGLEVTTDPPPVIDAIAPSSIANSGTQPITISGSDFRSPTVTFDCTDPGTGNTTTATVTTLTASTATSIDLDAPVTTLGSGICLVTVTNADGTTFEYSALSITSPAQNLYPFAPGTDLVVGRRAVAAISGRATAAARYVYAIGGDDGTDAGALDSIEVAPIDKFGGMGAWTLLPDALPAPRSHAGVARVGRFVYLVGGYDGTTAVDTVWRAQVLDPLDAPQFADLSIDYGTGTELGGGTWVYRIAALYDANDAINPGGESLPSDPIVVRLPDIPDRIVLTLTWTAAPRAVGYRVYRTPAADSGSNTEEHVTDVTLTTFTDTLAPTDPAVRPLPKGALGAWADEPALPWTARAPCVAAALDPVDPAASWLYAAGGLDDTGTVRDDIASIGISGATVGTWADAGQVLGTPAHECGAWTVDATYHSVVGLGESWVYFGAGRTTATGGQTTGEIVAGQVTSTGGLTGFGTVDTMNPTRAGFGTASASNFLYVFGGQNGGPSAGGKSSEILGPPDLDNWNAGINSSSRYLMGSAQESAVIFLIGGTTSSDAASHTTEQASF